MHAKCKVVCNWRSLSWANVTSIFNLNSPYIYILLKCYHFQIENKDLPGPIALLSLNSSCTSFPLNCEMIVVITNIIRKAPPNNAIVQFFLTRLRGKWTLAMVPVLSATHSVNETNKQLSSSLFSEVWNWFGCSVGSGHCGSSSMLDDWVICEWMLHPVLASPHHWKLLHQATANTSLSLQ